MRKDEVKEIGGKRTALTKASSLGIDIGELTCIPNSEFGGAIQRKYCSMNRGGTPKNRREDSIAVKGTKSNAFDQSRKRT